MILKVRKEADMLVHTADEVLACFHSFYANLYTSSLMCSSADIYEYLVDLTFPTFTMEQVTLLGSDITEKEVKRAIMYLAYGKASGPDGVLLEFYVYRCYRPCLGPGVIRGLQMEEVATFNIYHHRGSYSKT